MLIGCFRNLHRSVRLADQTANPMETRDLAYGILVAMVTYLVAGSFTERFYAESFWWVLALPLCLRRVAVREAATLEEEQLVLEHCPAISGEKRHAPVPTVTPPLTAATGGI